MFVPDYCYIITGITKYFILLEIVLGWRLETAFDPLASDSEVRDTVRNAKRHKAVSRCVALVLLLATVVIGLMGLIPGRGTVRLQAFGIATLFLLVFAVLLLIVVLFLTRVRRRYISPQFRQTRTLLTVILTAFTLSYLACATSCFLIYSRPELFSKQAGLAKF